MTIYYVDYINGLDTNNGLSWITAKRTTGGLPTPIAGDLIKIAKSPDETSLGQNATWTNVSKNVILTSPVTAEINDCDTIWTAGANVTASVVTATMKEGTGSCNLVTGAGVIGAQLLAYKTIPLTDFSAYQQISFWMRTETIALTAGLLEVRLCSDTLGAVAVDTFALPTTNGVSGAAWFPLTLNKGSALGNAIQSIAIYTTGSFASKTLKFDNFIACKAISSPDSLSLTSLISKNTEGEGWYPIQSIDGTTIKIDNNPNTIATAGRGYYGTTETVALYKRETTKTDMQVSAATNACIIKGTGTSVNWIIYEGGWNPLTDIKDGLTFLDGQIGTGIGICAGYGAVYGTYDNVSGISVCRYEYGFYTYNGGTNIILNIPDIIGCTTSGVLVRSPQGGNPLNITIGNCNNNAVGISFWLYVYNIILTVGNCNNNLTAGMGTTTEIRNNVLVFNNVCNNGTVGISLATVHNSLTVANCNYNTGNGCAISTAYFNTVNIGNANYNTSCGLAISSASFNKVTISKSNNNGYGVGLDGYPQDSYNNIIDILEAKNNTNYGIWFNNCCSNIVKNCITSGNILGGIYIKDTDNYLNNCILNETSPVVIFQNYGDAHIFSQNDGGILNNHKIYCNWGLIQSDNSVRHTSSGISWKLSPTDTRRNTNYPLELSVAKIQVTANTLVTIKAWLRKDHAVNITGRLICKGGQITGVDNDVSIDISNVVDTWEEVTITFTPTAIGVVEILCQAFGGSTYNVWIDDLKITQI